MATDKIISFVMNTIDDFRENLTSGNLSPEKLWDRFRKGVTSINREANKSILFFPVLVSDSCNFELARKATTAIESRSAMMVKMIIERIGLIRLQTGETKQDLINHVKGFDGIVGESAAEALRVPGMRTLVEGPSTWIGLVDEGLRRESIDGSFEVVVKEAKGDIPFAPDDDDDLARKAYDRAMRIKRSGRDPKAALELELGIAEKNRKSRDEYDQKMWDRKIEKEKELSKLKIEREEELGNIKRSAKEGEFIDAERRDVQKKAQMVKDAPDIGASWAGIAKRENRSDPTRLEVEVEYATDYTVERSRFTLGVKCPMHVIPSEEFVRFIPKAKFDMSFLIQVARLWTGEIGFMRDFILNMSEIEGSFDKVQAGSGKWYATLKRLTSTNKVRGLLGKTKMPTVSLIVSMEDVQEMFRATNGRFDLTNKVVAKSVIDSLTILNLLIIDEANSKVWWFDDGAQDFDMLTAAELENEKKNLSQSDLMKALIAVKA